ncbi:MAG: hypothetical protein R8F63_15305 [Acidimicrobiales bacterium]|nr:hypothetical protein [Acidimicrobiales bacterium]
MQEMTAPDSAGVVADHPLCCGRCDVAWRGAKGDLCWVCGDPGVPRGEVRIVEDEPAA